MRFPLGGGHCDLHLLNVVHFPTDRKADDGVEGEVPRLDLVFGQSDLGLPCRCGGSDKEGLDDGYLLFGGDDAVNEEEGVGDIPIVHTIESCIKPTLVGNDLVGNEPFAPFERVGHEGLVLFIADAVVHCIGIVVAPLEGLNGHLLNEMAVERIVRFPHFGFSKGVNAYEYTCIEVGEEGEEGGGKDVLHVANDLEGETKTNNAFLTCKSYAKLSLLVKKICSPHFGVRCIYLYRWGA